MIFFRLSPLEKEIPPIEEKPAISVSVNGIDSPSHERSRSPSPTSMTEAVYSNDTFTPIRPSYLNQNSYSLSLNNESASSLANDLGYNVSFEDNKLQISQILKEANSFSLGLQNSYPDYGENKNIKVF